MKQLTKLSKTFFVLSFIKFIFIISLILALVLWSLPILSFNIDIWLIFQKRGGVILDQKNVSSYNELIVNFFREGLKLDFLNVSELTHMEEVRKVVVIANVLSIVSFSATLSSLSYFSKTDRKFLLNALRKVSLSVFILSLIIFVLVVTNFYASFIAFHKILLLRNFIFPADSILKILYPDEFFFGIGAFYLLSIMIVSLAVTIISHRLKFK